MTLVEVVVAVTLLALLMLGLGASLGAGLRLIRTDRQRVVAANLVSQQMERLRSMPFAANLAALRVALVLGACACAAVG